MSRFLWFSVYVHGLGLLLPTAKRGLLVDLSVCLSLTLMSPAKTPEPIKMPFGLRTWVDPRNHY